MQKYSVFSLFPVLLAVLCISCSKMDDSFREYVVPGGITYVGRADSVLVHPGRERLKITWRRGTDPNTRKAVVYWNNKADSLVVPITQTNPNDTVTAMIDKLPEGTYPFFIYTYDDHRNSSIRVDVLGSSYGKVYESIILSRTMGSVKIAGDDVTVKWLKGDTTCISTEINYIDLSGVSKRVFIPASEDIIVLEDVKEGSTLSYRSLYKPGRLSLDTFYTVYETRPLNIASGKAVKHSSAETANPGTRVVDDSTNTFWQPLATDRKDDKKVWVTVDLKSPKEFNQVKQIWNTGNGLLEGYKILGSDNETTWTTLYEKTSAPTAVEDVSFPATTKRYVRLELTIKTDGNLQVSEVEIYKR